MITDESRAAFARIMAKRDAMAADCLEWAKVSSKRKPSQRELEAMAQGFRQGFDDAFRLLRDTANLAAMIGEG